jgi:hypothetical protein
MTNRYKIFNDVWNKENFLKIKGFRGRVESLGTSVSDREHGTIADGAKLRRTWNKSFEITEIGCHVGGCASIHVPVGVVKLHVVEGGDEGRVDLLLVLVPGEIDRLLLLLVLVCGVRTLSSVGLGCHAGARAEKSLRGRLPGRRGMRLPGHRMWGLQGPY